MDLVGGIGTMLRALKHDARARKLIALVVRELVRRDRDRRRRRR